MGFGSGEAILVHDPIGFRTPRGPSLVEHKELLHPHYLVEPTTNYLPIFPCRLPIPGHRRPVRSNTVWVFRLYSVEEVSLIFAPTFNTKVGNFGSIFCKRY